MARWLSPAGRWAGTSRRGPSPWAAAVVPLLVATAATMALSVAERAHCIQKGWTGSDQFWHACFSDLPALYQLATSTTGLAAYVGRRRRPGRPPGPHRHA